MLTHPRPAPFFLKILTMSHSSRACLDKPTQFRTLVIVTTGGLSSSQSQSKFHDTRMCKYCKKPRPIKVNFLGSASQTEQVTTNDMHILTVESSIEAEVLLTTEEFTNWLLNSGASYHGTSFRSLFQSYIARDFELVRATLCSNQHRISRIESP